MSKMNFKKLKMYQAGLRYILIAFTGAFLLGACEDENGTDADDPAVPLSVSGASVKAPGRGQYRLQTLSGDEVQIAANLASLESLKSFTITKTVNLSVDPNFGSNGVLTVDASAVDAEYLFKYKPPTTDIDQLVAFAFRAETTSGTLITSDLQLVVTLSPRDNLPRRKWLWTAKVWVDGGDVPDFKDCEKDNYYLFNADGTVALNFGTKTGVPGSGCDYDAFNEYETWSLSEDEKELVIISHSIFSPDLPKIETYRVKTLTTEKLELEIEYNLTDFGLGSEETYMFQFTAQPK
jgi:hypothetical protein